MFTHIALAAVLLIVAAFYLLANWIVNKANRIVAYQKSFGLTDAEREDMIAKIKTTGVSTKLAKQVGTEAAYKQTIDMYIAVNYPQLVKK